MKSKLLIYIMFVIVIGIAVFFTVKSFTKDKFSQIKEYIPQEEISEEQERKTLVTLYFQSKENKDVMPEARLVDSKILLNNPYEALIKLLLDGPKNDKLQAIIPEGTNLIDAKAIGNTAILNFSSKFIDGTNLGKEQEEKIINSIVNTLTQLSEIDSVKILIEGKEDMMFLDKCVGFEEKFKRVD